MCNVHSNSDEVPTNKKGTDGEKGESLIPYILSLWTMVGTTLIKKPGG